jgi:AraC-like DNA-binding protein
MISLDNTPLTVIASKCGFQSLSHFSKAFKQQFGVSPLQYRKSQDDISTTPPWS